MMFSRATVSVSVALLASPVLGSSIEAQGRERRALLESSELGTSHTVVLDGLVLEPDGSPAAGAIVASSAGGRTVTRLDGGYRLEVRVPRGAESVEVTAVADESDDSTLASTSVALRASSGSLWVEPLSLALGSGGSPRWRPAFGSLPGVDGPINAMQAFDDGSGPALYVGGFFQLVGAVPASNIARWDGTGWSVVGGGLSSEVYALAVFDDGNGPALYAGGRFLTAPPLTSVHFIAKWDGTNWSPLGSGFSPLSTGYVHALAVFDDGNGPALYAGGAFTSADGQPASRIAKWDGASWAGVGGGVSGTVPNVNALTVFDDGNGPGLYAGGSFTSAGGVSAARIAKWDGTSWAALGSGASNQVWALTSFDDGNGPALFAGGNFEIAGGVPANYIAKWDGTSWSALAGGMNGPVNALMPLGSELVSGSDGAPHHIAKWNGTSWSPMQGGMQGETGTSVRALALFDDGTGSALFAGGYFNVAGGKAALGFAKWTGSSWSSIKGGLNASVSSLTFHDDGSGPALYAGGSFTAAGEVLVSHIARRNGSGWTPLGSGMDGSVYELLSYDDGSGPALYAGGSFETAGGVAASNIARWDGTSWAPLGSGMDALFGHPHDVLALAAFDDGSGPALYAGGSFDSAGGVAAEGIARWDGQSWSAVGVPPSSNAVQSFAVFDDGSGPALFTAGLGGVAKWDGATWTVLPWNGTGAGYRDALAVFDDGSGPALYVAGRFDTLEGLQVNCIARWDGSSWSAVGGGFTGISSREVFCLTVFDDGSGPALYAGGNFNKAGGLAALGLARWDGCSWSALGSGSTGFPSVFAVSPGGVRSALIVGGGFSLLPDSGDAFLGWWGSTAKKARPRVR